MMLTTQKCADLGILQDVRVKLNGMTMNNCEMADEENGKVVLWCIDKFVPGMADVPREMLYGDVEILMGDRK